MSRQAVRQTDRVPEGCLQGYTCSSAETCISVSTTRCYGCSGHSPKCDHLTDATTTSQIQPPLRCNYLSDTCITTSQIQLPLRYNHLSDTTTSQTQPPPRYNHLQVTITSQIQPPLNLEICFSYTCARGPKLYLAGTVHIDRVLH